MCEKDGGITCNSMAGNLISATNKDSLYCIHMHRTGCTNTHDHVVAQGLTNRYVAANFALSCNATSTYDANCK
jgi:hypothetical protein